MKKTVFLFVGLLLLGTVFTACSKDEADDELMDGPEFWKRMEIRDSIQKSLGYYKEGPFIGNFNVVITDGNSKVSECEMNTYEGIHLNVPSDYLIPKMMPVGSSYTLNEGQCWGGQNFGYPIETVNGDTYRFKVIAPAFNLEQFIYVLGTYGEYGAWFVAEYEESTATYDKAKDMWEGDIKFNTLHVLNSLVQTMLEIKLQTPYTLHFYSTGRIK